MDIGVVTLATLLGVSLAYIADRAGLPPFLGFFLSGITIGTLANISFPMLYLDVMIALIAFEIGRQLGFTGISPAAFFAAIIEASIIVGLSVFLLNLVGFSITQALIVAVMLFSSSSLLTFKLTQDLPEYARSIAMSLTILEDVIFFFSLSLLLGKADASSLPVNIVILIALAIISWGLFSYLYRFIIGREYALPYALALSFAFVKTISFLQIAPPYLGAFISGYLFSRADEHRLHDREATALSGLISYFYMLALGLSSPPPTVSPLLALGFALAGAAVVTRSLAIFLATYFVVGRPGVAAGVAFSMAHISELSLTLPIIAVKLGYLPGELGISFVITILSTLFLAPYIYKLRPWAERYAVSRFRELPSVTAYERLYRVLSRAFVTAAKLTVTALAAAFSAAYLGLLSLVVLAAVSYLLYKYSREIYTDLLLAVREVGEARYASAVILASTFFLALYAVLASLQRVAEVHIYVALAALATILASLYAAMRELMRRTKPLDEGV